MRNIVLGLLLPVLSFPALAQAVFKGSDFIVFFYSEPCEIPPLIQPLSNIGQARRAMMIHEGKRIEACFAKDDDGDYLLILSDGRGGWIPGRGVQPGA